jgi:hypothetical protein
MSLPGDLQGQQGAALRTDIEKLFGTGAIDKIHQLLDKALRREGGSYASSIKPWLGSHIGVALLSMPSLISLITAESHGGVGSAGGALGMAILNEVAVVIPTNNPSAASSFLQQIDKGKPPFLTTAVHGNYLLIGGHNAVAAVEATSSSNSLASTAAYKAIGGEQPASTIYMALGRLVRAFAGLTALARLGGGGAIPPAMLRAEQQKIAKIPVDAADLVTLNASSSALRIDEMRFHGLPLRLRTSVSGLPADSWLAASTGPFKVPAAAERALLSLAQGAEAQLGQRLRNLPGAQRLPIPSVALLEDILGAAGPATLAATGNSAATLGLGLTVAPSDMASAKRLLGLAYAAASRHGRLVGSGSATDFKIRTKRGRVFSLSASGAQIVGLIKYPDAQAFLHPATTLGSNPEFRSAAANLEPGSSVPLYISFPQLVMIGSQESAHPAKAETALRKLKYLIVGVTSNDIRLVLGLN